MAARPGIRTLKPLRPAVLWATEACGRLTTGDFDYAQADIDELIVLRRGGEDLARLSVELFQHMVRATAPLNAQLLMELTIPFPTHTDLVPGVATYAELLEAIQYPKNLRGFHVPGFSIDRRRPELPMRAGKTIRASCGSFYVESTEILAEHVVTSGHAADLSEHRLLFSKAPTGLELREARIPPYT